MEETLPPAEEIESDRQQRVYRGQPSTVGQVQKDRDGIRHSNAIQVSSSRLVAIIEALDSLIADEVVTESG